MARYILTTPAANDLREIVQYIRQRSPQGAKLVRSELRAAMQRLASFPRMGHLREDVTDEPYRFWSVYSYLIVYLPETKPLEIVRVMHGARDLGKFFKTKKK
jgi:plasmid stabilization system protein ParE